MSDEKILHSDPLDDRAGADLQAENHASEPQTSEPVDGDAPDEEHIVAEDHDVLEEPEEVGETEVHSAIDDGVHSEEAEQAVAALEASTGRDVAPPDESGTSADLGADRESVVRASSFEEPSGPIKNWYIIHAYSGFENKVAESLRSRAQAFGFADRLGQLLIPTEEVIELRNGKKVTSKRLLYPGYVLVEMEMDDELWHAVKSTPRVTGFVGGGTKPVPLTADEVNSVLYRQASSADRPRPKMTFEKSETVKIVDGPFTNFSGKVDEVNSERNTLRVMVTIFGRSTPVELDFLQVEKM